MPGINTIRKVTPLDTARLEAAAVRFAARHGFDIYDAETAAGESAAEQVHKHCDWQRDSDRPRLARLWQACFCRALGFKPSSDLTIAYGYVGTRC